MMLRTAVLSALLSSVIGCAPTIRYGMSELSRIDDSELKKLSISIQPFEDSRKTASYLRDAIFTIAHDNRSECYNLEVKYKKLIVCEQLSKLLAEHIDSTGIFKKVYYNQKEKADLYLTGTIVSFAAHTNVNESARTTRAVGSQFGLIGALVSMAVVSGMKSNFDFEIKYDTITAYDKSNTIVYRVREIASTENKEIQAVTSCRQIFYLINSELKKHNQKLIDKMVAELPGSMKSMRR